ncbi:cell division protein ZipA [Glaciecola sp. SC05]|uniref:cell division protein ZipA n=1 Tax=Glaciecola sp. SC05 TaxID=1987355 RepID=UPI003526C512
MQDELRITFFVIGIVFIVGILVHGAWTIRKNKRQSKPNNFQAGRSYEPRFDEQYSDDGDYADDDIENVYDDVGVSQARVISTGNITSSVAKGDDTKQNGENIDDATITSTPLLVDEDELLDGVEAKKRVIIDDLADISSDEQEPIHSSPLTNNEGAHKESNNASNVAKSAPLYSGVVTQPKPGFHKANKNPDSTNEETDIPEPPEFLLRKTPATADPSLNDSHANEPASSASDATEQEPAPDFSLNVQDGPVKPQVVKTEAGKQDKPAGVEKELSFAEQAKRFVTRRKKTVAEKIRKEPNVKGANGSSDEQMRIDFESAAAKGSAFNEPKLGTPQIGDDAVSNAKKPAPQSDVLVLNVRANAENPIGGAALLPMLLTLGFKFGEHDIFHRHVNTNGKGPILFSLTNMFKPGVFDIDNIENFTTLGVSLFMMLPIEGEAQQVFNMMHNAARKISEEFDCKILDGNKVLLSKQSLQHYSERIREFERSRFSR